MKILQILPNLKVGGVETGTVDFAKYLVSHGHQAIVISNGGVLVERLERNGAKHYKLPVHKKSIFTAWKMIKAVRKIIQDEKVDIVHARSRVPAWIAFFACRRTNASFITTCHGYYKSFFFSQIMGWSKLVIVPSSVIGRHMIDTFHVPSESIRVIPRSVDLDRFQIERRPSKNPTIVMIGRLTPIKGHAFFLHAMTKVIRHVPFARIWIIGDADEDKQDYKKELIQLVERLGLKDCVEFLGNRQDIPELLSQADCLVFPSIVPESFGRVILEAQAAHVPVVASQIGGVVDIIDDGQTGILVPPKDVEALAKETVRVLTDKVLANKLVEAAYIKLKNNFMLEHMASATVKVYEELLNLMNILVIKIGAIGDVVLVTASLRALREKFPKAKIYCLVGQQARAILQSCPYVDGLIIFDPKGKDRNWLKLWKMAQRLRRYNLDKIIDFQNTRKTHILSFLSFPRESYGYKRKWGALLTNPIEDKVKDLAPVAHQFQVLSQLGIGYTEHSFLELWPMKKDDQYIKALLESEWLGNSKNIVGINISASPRWQTKNWPLSYMAQLIDSLSSKNIRVVITGQDKDMPLARELLSLTKSKPAILVGKTDIMQLAALMKNCKVFITPDSAPLHIAAAMRTPVIALFGPTSAARHRPPAKKMVILEKKPICGPCYSATCKVQTHICMRDIKPEEVLKEVEMLIGESA